jgi:ubiquinone/menaquinone biosynthesis C-methylase UbiE
MPTPIPGDIHRAAREGFGRSADAYERGRPDYPRDAVDFLVETLGIRPGRKILDLAAGTGKLTRMLTPRGADFVAVEPVEGMRRAFIEALSTVEVLDGRAEAIPLQDASVDAAVVAQAFHWFDAPAALAELHRVLRPDGSLALIWNVRDDERSAFWAGLTALLAPLRGGVPSHRAAEWRRAFDDTDLFTRPETRSFRHEQLATSEAAVDRVVSTSFVATLPGEARDELRRDVLELFERDPTRRGNQIELPYRTDVHWCRRAGER